MNSATPSAPTSQPPLSELESEVIALFVDLGRWFGAPKSLGAIYGLLFISESPICFEQIGTRLQMSNGSVSQGLRILKDLGAVRTAFLPGERREFFVAETQLRLLTTNLLRRHVERQLLNGEGRLSRLFDQMMNGNEVRTVSMQIQERLNLLKRWQEQARRFLPLALETLEG